ncbi:hypothetical protein LXM60_20050 [Pandoraea sputorum]|uniref:hypothetical protein n=1 Tax=Pandoraea sputorum TaxID=93222 RepID=UPI001E41BE70|nr:hypothetical protein [Pandoraea sputorum]MCE4062498.1 hypothetical protein [Pandoraea sputorum]
MNSANVGSNSATAYSAVQLTETDSVGDHPEMGTEIVHARQKLEDGTGGSPSSVGGQVRKTLAPSPAADFNFFRMPLKAGLYGRWEAAAQAGSQSEEWSDFLSFVSKRYFKDCDRRRMMDGLVLSLDILPKESRADALVCLLEDASEGRDSAAEFCEYVGIDIIPEADRPRVAELLRKHNVGF